MSAEGLQRSAILMMSLGESEAAEVLKHLGPREVQKLGATMAALKNVSRERVLDAFDAFFVEAEDLPLDVDSNEYIRTVFRKALGDDRAANIIDRILSGGDTSGIEGLKWMDASSVAELIRNEHPQIIAIVLAHLDPDQSAEVLKSLPERTRADVLLRIATLDGIPPNALHELNEIMERQFSGQNNLKSSSVGGVKLAANIINQLDTSTEQAVMALIRDIDQDLGSKIQDLMFVFDDLGELDDRAMQALLREVPQDRLGLALRGADPRVKDKVLANMSQRAAQILVEDMEARGPVRLSDVEAAQKEILGIARKLADEGTIVLGPSASEAFV